MAAAAETTKSRLSGTDVNYITALRLPGGGRVSMTERERGVTDMIQWRLIPALGATLRPCWHVVSKTPSNDRRYSRVVRVCLSAVGEWSASYRSHVSQRPARTNQPKWHSRFELTKGSGTVKLRPNCNLTIYLKFLSFYQSYVLILVF